VDLFLLSAATPLMGGWGRGLCGSAGLKRIFGGLAATFFDFLWI
jgi:hypothetical protein